MPSGFAEPRRSASAVAALCVAAAVAVSAVGCKREPPAAPLVPPPPTLRPDHEAPKAVVRDPLSPGAEAGAEHAPGVTERAALPGLIAFVREVDGRKRPHLVRPDGRGLRALPAPDGMDAVVMAASLDGRYLAGVAAVGEGEAHLEQLLVWTLPSGEVRAVGPRSRRARHPVFSPDGRRIAFESGHERFSNLYVLQVDAKEGALLRVTDSEAGDFEPSWSADGAYLAFASSREGDPEIFRIRVDDVTAEGAVPEPERLTAFHREDVAPRWSSGRAPGQIAFLSDRAGEDALYLMAPDGARQRRLGPPGAAREHTWSSDGRALLLAVRTEGGKARVAKVDAQTGETTFLSPGRAVEDMPSFAPGGAHAVYVSDEGGRPALWLVRADGTGHARLLSASGAGEDAGHRHGAKGAHAQEGDWLPLWFSGSSG